MSAIIVDEYYTKKFGIKKEFLYSPSFLALREAIDVSEEQIGVYLICKVEWYNGKIICRVHLNGVQVGVIDTGKRYKSVIVACDELAKVFKREIHEGCLEKFAENEVAVLGLKKSLFN